MLFGGYKGLLRLACMALILIVFAINISNAKLMKQFFLKLTKTECSGNPKYVTNVSCILKSKSRTNFSLSAEAYLTEPTSNIWVNGELFRQYSEAHKYQPFLINVTANVCHFLESMKSRSLYFNFVYNLMKESSNINHTCPYSGLLTLKNLIIEVSQFTYFRLKFLAPEEGSYYANFKFFQNNKNFNASLGYYRVYALYGSYNKMVKNKT